MIARFSLIALVLFAVPVFGQTAKQLADWCYGDATDEETVRGCDAEIASGRARNLADAYGNRGYAYNQQGHYDKAMADHNMSIQLRPTAQFYNNRGWTLNNMARYQEALKDLDNALRLDPKLASAYNNRGVSYMNLGQFDRAIQEYDTALRLTPGRDLYVRNRALAVEAKEKAGTDVTQASPVSCEPKLNVLDGRLLSKIKISEPYRQAYIDKRSDENRLAFCRDNVSFMKEMGALIDDVDKAGDCKNTPAWVKFRSDVVGTLGKSKSTHTSVCK